MSGECLCGAEGRSNVVSRRVVGLSDLPESYYRYDDNVQRVIEGEERGPLLRPRLRPRSFPDGGFVGLSDETPPFREQFLSARELNRR